jgi:hypothetical protein
VVDGIDRWQEAQSNVFQIEPAQTLRTISLLYPNVSNKIGTRLSPFSAQISVMNIGSVKIVGLKVGMFRYSQIRQVRLVNILPDISSIEMNEPLQFRLDSILIGGYEHSNMLDVNLGNIESGETRQILINFSTQNQVSYLNHDKLKPNFLGGIFAKPDVYVCIRLQPSGQLFGPSILCPQANSVK